MLSLINLSARVFYVVMVGNAKKNLHGRLRADDTHIIIFFVHKQ